MLQHSNLRVAFVSALGEGNIFVTSEGTGEGILLHSGLQSMEAPELLDERFSVLLCAL